ncbi:MAG: DUF1292 domain-containing protein [Eubacteriales bacterium]|nr:DUF1292 domain-containing protein [Eubacteriales bacterium]
MSDFENNCSGNCDSCGSDCVDTEHASVTLTLDSGEELECAILTIFPANGHKYIALLPLDENGENEDGEVFLYRFAEENGNPMLDNIEDDEEYEMAADAFDEWMDNQEFEDLGGIIEED